MRTVVRVILSFIAGFVAAYLVVVAGSFWYAHVNNVVDRDGGLSMGIIFMIGPAAGILGGIIAAIAIPIRLARRERAAASTAPAQTTQRLPPKVRALIAAVIAFVVVDALSWFAVRLIFGTTFSTYGTALAVSLLPHGFGALGAALAATRVLRKARREAASAV